MNETEARFWLKIDTHGPTPIHAPELGPCWQWLAGIDADGYGRFNYEGTNQKAHRVAWKFFTGHFPRKNLLHRCDNTRCVRQTHLYEGTQQDNVKDRDLRHRRNAVGEKNGSTKLTEKLVKYIRECTKPGRTLAKLLGVSDATISAIRLRKTWRHV